MGENTGIAWCDHTWNPWIGCQKVSPACEHCYAEVVATNRMRLPVWGPPSTTKRHRTSASTWSYPKRWNKAAAKAGRRARVFCASLADVFEAHPMVAQWRMEVFDVIESTPNLDWLLLTKRPENLVQMLPREWLAEPRNNVWLGTTVEDQKRAMERVPALLRVPAARHFLSVEPMLGPINLRKMEFPDEVVDAFMGVKFHTREKLARPLTGRIDWLIVGGESGSGARPFVIDDAMHLLGDARRSGVATFFKQLGERPVAHAATSMWAEPNCDGTSKPVGAATMGWPTHVKAVHDSDASLVRFYGFHSKKGDDPDEWPNELRLHRNTPASVMNHEGTCHA